MSDPTPPPPTTAGDEPPAPRVMAACLVLAAVGLAAALALGFLAYAAVKIFRDLGGDQAGTEPPPPDRAAGGRPDPVTPTKLAKDRDKIEEPGEYDAVCRGGG